MGATKDGKKGGKQVTVKGKGTGKPLRELIKQMCYES